MVNTQQQMVNKSVNLVSISKPTDYTKTKTAEETIAWVARVSNPSNQNNSKTAIKLLKYLILHKHWSPFEMMHLCIEIKSTRDITKQILRHKSFSFQEYSQRYADPTKDLGFVLRETRLQDAKNRQASHELTEDQNPLISSWVGAQQNVINTAKETYQWAIENGIAKEQARSVLPEGNTESVILMAGSVRSWIHYCLIRRNWDTQKEHRLIADACWEILREYFSSICEALDEIQMAEDLKSRIFTAFTNFQQQSKNSCTENAFVAMCKLLAVEHEEKNAH